MTEHVGVPPQLPLNDNEEDDDGVLLEHDSSDRDLLATPVLVGRSGGPSPPPLNDGTGTTQEDSVLSLSPTDESILEQDEITMAQKQNERFCRQHNLPAPMERRPTERFMEDASLSVVLVEEEDGDEKGVILESSSAKHKADTKTLFASPSQQSTWTLPSRPPSSFLSATRTTSTSSSTSITASFRGNFEQPPTQESLTPRLQPRKIRSTSIKQDVTIPMVDVGTVLEQLGVLSTPVPADPASILHALVRQWVELDKVQALWESAAAKQSSLSVSQTSVDLPELTSQVGVPPALQKLLQATGQGGLPLLLQLPLELGHVLLRLVVRLLTHEDDTSYDTICLRISPAFSTAATNGASSGTTSIDNSLLTDADHASRRPHLLYAVVRWRCLWPDVLDRLATLTETASVRPALHSWIPHLSRLAGVLATPGVTPAWLRRWMGLCSSGTHALKERLGLVRGLTTAAAGAAPPLWTKAAPNHIFVFNGQAPLARSIKGLTAWPFRNDFGMATWFRLEYANKKATLLRVQADDGAGVAVSIVPLSDAAFTLAVEVTHADGHHMDPQRLQVSACVLMPRLWYHVAVRHTRSRLKGVFSLSTRQHLTLALDGKTILHQSLPFPRLWSDDDNNTSTTSSLLLRSNTVRTSSRINLEVVVGQSLVGQLGAVYIFKEAVSDASLRALYEATGGGKERAIKKSTTLGGGWDSRHSEIVRKSRVLDVRLKHDDAEEIVLSQRKSYLNRRRGLQDKNLAVLDMGGGEDAESTEVLPPDLLGVAFGSKIFVAWDPRRSWEGFLFELHAGAHLTMEGVQAWSCHGAQEVISSLGGVQALIPLFRTLIAISASTDMSTADNGGVPLPVLSRLFELLAAFVLDHSENARELLRCGGIDIVEQLLIATKKVTVSRPRYTSLFVALSLSSSLADQLVHSLLMLRSACGHYVGLETKVFSRLLFNFNLWLCGLPSTCGPALHLRLLPVLASLTRLNPEKVRDCVGVRDMVLMLKEPYMLQRGENRHENRFNTPVLSDSASRAKLSEIERRHVCGTILGMIAEVLCSGTTAHDLSPFLNFISAGIGQENPLESGCGNAIDKDVQYEMMTNACLALLMLLQSRPLVSGLFESFAQCCGSVQGAVAWILSVLVNSKDDTRRALGIRCVWSYVDAMSRGDEQHLGIASSLLPPETDLVLTDGSTVARASSRVASLAKGFASMNTVTKPLAVSPSKYNPKVVYKLLWHFLRSHRTELGSHTRLALLYCMTNSNERFNGTSFGSIRGACSVNCHHEDVGGQYIIVGQASSHLEEPSGLVGLSLKHKLTASTVLRLLRYLQPMAMDTWLSDLIFLSKSSKQSVSLLSSTVDWQPSLFHLVSETVEGLSHARLSSTYEVSETLSRRLDLCLKLYGTLLGQTLREGGDKALDAVETAASLQRVCVNGNVVFLLALSSLCMDVYDHGTLLEMGAMATNDWKDLDLDHDSLLLKQSAKLVTNAILSNGTKGLDIAVAVRSWRCLRHLAEVVVAMITKSGFGVVSLFDYSTQRASSIDSISNGLHGIRLADSRIPAIDAAQYVAFLDASGLSLSSSEENIEDAKKEINRRLCVTLTAQLLTLLDAFIFPDSLDASLPVSQLHGLALVRNSEPRLGSSQGPLVASAIRLSFLLLNTLEPCSVKFLQCASRLRCLIQWALDLIRETTVQEGSLPAFDPRVSLLDRLILATVLHCHRSLGRCASLLSEIESSSHDKYFENKESHKRHYRRLLRVALELRDVVSVAYKGRNSVLLCTFSTESFEHLRESLEGDRGVKFPSRESTARDFLSSNWVCGYQDVEIKADLAIPEQIAMNTIPLSSDEISSEQHGFSAMERLANEGKSILADFERALNAGFESYLESQRKWAETDAVRELESEGDTMAKRLAEKTANDASEFAKINSARRSAADNRWHGVQRKAILPWTIEKHWKLGNFADKHGRRILLVQNDNYDPHIDADYELSLGSRSAKPDIDNSDRRGSLTDLIRRNADAFMVQELASVSDATEEDSFVQDSDGESSTDLESSTDGEMSDPPSENKRIDPADESEYDEEWDKIDTKEIAHVDAEGDVDGWARAFIWSENETVVARFDSVMIVSLQVYVTGKMVLTTHGLYFRQTGDEMSVMTKEPVQSSETPSEKRDRRWRLTRLTEIHGRRYLLRQQAIELFFSDCHELFINFPGGVKDRDRFHAKLRNNCKVPMLWSPKSLNPRVIFRRSRMTELWVKRKISTFEYLMALNRMAGRSFNDITQYPVFPWILADYTSDNIDLNDSRVYRDLTKPIGALNPDRLSQLLERYKDLELFGFPEAERFLYGSHYSSPGIILHLLIRQEPFTTMAIELQSGRFDCPDRLFFDIGSSWNGVLTSSSDFKELIPEMFCLPEALLNTNDFPLGITQSGRRVDDVGLPPWAKGSAYEFIRIQRLALESEYVSHNIHHWIDLIFGYKQRGEEAEAAHNIFHHLSYEGAVDLDKITDEVDRLAAESHIQNFGQTPSQLSVIDPHPERLAAEDCWRPLIYDVTIPKCLRCYRPSRQFGNANSEYGNGAVVRIHPLSDSLIVIYSDMSVGTYRYAFHHKSQRLKMDRLRPLARRDLSVSRVAMKRGSAVPAEKVEESPYSIHNHSFGLTIGGKAKEELRRNAVLPSGRLISGTELTLSGAEASSMMISCGYFDDTIKVHSTESLELLASENGGHQGPIRCIAIASDGLMVTGGEDGTCRVWVVDHSDMAVAISDGYVQTALGASNDGDQLLSCCHVLWGHDTPITCVDIDSDLDVIVSGSQGGTVCVHTIRRGEFIRSFRPPCLGDSKASVSRVALDTTGNMVVHMSDGGLHSFTVNGVELASADAGENIHDMCICSNGEFLVTGGDDCKVRIRTVCNLKVNAVLDLTRHGPIRCIAMTPDDLNPSSQYLFIGSDDGSITLVDRDPDL